MRISDVWWEHIASSIKLVDDVSNSIIDGNNIVFEAIDVIPWKSLFYEYIDKRRAALGDDRRLTRFVCNADEEPGEQIMREYCSRTLQDDYWPGQTYGEFIGQNNNKTIAGYHIWVCGLSSENDVRNWQRFIREYQATVKEGEVASFVLETAAGVTAPSSGFKNFVYKVQQQDCRIFCLQVANLLQNCDVSVYQAEFAFNIGQNNPELCAYLINVGEILLSNPVDTVRFCEKETFGVNTLHTANEILSAFWKTSIALLFPIIEQFRMSFVDKHRMDLEEYLPITDNWRNEIVDPSDLEIGQVCYLVEKKRHIYAPKEYSDIKFCRDVRNMLAHINTVSLDMIKRAMCEL